MSYLVSESQSMFIQIPIASGTTTAMIVSMLHHVFANPHMSRVVKALFIASTEHEAIGTYSFAKNLSQSICIQIGCVMRSHQTDANSVDIMIGTMNEVLKNMSQIDKKILTHVYINCAEKNMSDDLFGSFWKILTPHQQCNSSGRRSIGKEDASQKINELPNMKHIYEQRHCNEINIAKYCNTQTNQ